MGPKCCSLIGYAVYEPLLLLTRPSECKTFLGKMSFICMIIKNHFHKKGFALGLVLKQRLAASRKWPIVSGLVYQSNELERKK